MTVKSCIKSMRLRTLPLSLAGVIVGIHLALTAVPASLGTSSDIETANLVSQPIQPSIPTIVFLILTTVLLQILSNLSNELGDTLHGTDTSQRQGIHYSLQDGNMTIDQMKRFIGVIAVLCCICGVAMIYFSFGTLLSLQSAAFVLLGAAAIWAAMHYTLGDNPYGYRGHGDIFVFIFFGLVSTLGAAFICAHTISPAWLLPAAAFGCWSVGVLNVNNIRDMATDAATRTTVAIKLGLKNARIYHTILISAGWVLMLAGTAPSTRSAWDWAYVVLLPLSVIHLRAVWTKTGKALDPMLPMLVMTTFGVAILSLL